MGGGDFVVCVFLSLNTYRYSCVTYADALTDAYTHTHTNTCLHALTTTRACLYACVDSAAISMTIDQALLWVGVDDNAEACLSHRSLLSQR